MTMLVVPATVLAVGERAIQVHGAAGGGDDLPLAAMWRYNRMLRIGDGADEVHKQSIARQELRKFTDAGGEPQVNSGPQAEAAAVAAPAPAAAR